MPELAGNRYHTAGLAGYGSSSYIDAVILRDDEFDGGEWPEEADATLDRRVYYCQNWRADVVAILAGLAESPQSAARRGRLIERAWPRAKARDGQAPYGTPHGSTNGDFTGSATGADDHYLVPNGIVDGDDQTVFSTLFSAPDDLADMTGSSDSGDPDYGRPDGTIDASDLFFWLDCNGAADDLGRNVLSEGHTGASLGTFSVRNRKGLAGYEWDPAINKYHVRNRVLDPDTGRWTRRDPLGYVDGMGLYEYSESQSMVRRDPSGLATHGCSESLGCGGGKAQPGNLWQPHRRRIADCASQSQSMLSCVDCCIDTIGFDIPCYLACHNKFYPPTVVIIPKIPIIVPWRIEIPVPQPISHRECSDLSGTATGCRHLVATPPDPPTRADCARCCFMRKNAALLCSDALHQQQINECYGISDPIQRSQCITDADRLEQQRRHTFDMIYHSCHADCYR